MTKNLFVARLSYNTTSDSLSKHFSEMGTVVSAQVIMDKYTNQSKGFGFVEMSTEAEAAEAMQKLENSVLDGRNIAISEARPRTEGNFRGNGQRDNYKKGNRYGRDRY